MAEESRRGRAEAPPPLAMLEQGSVNGVKKIRLLLSISVNALKWFRVSPELIMSGSERKTFKLVLCLAANVTYNTF